MHAEIKGAIGSSIGIIGAAAVWRDELEFWVKILVGIAAIAASVSTALYMRAKRRNLDKD